MDSSVEYIVQRIAALEERFMEVATARRAPHTTVRGGSIRLAREDATGASVLLGSNGGGEAGVWLIDGDGETFGYLGTAGAETAVLFDNPDSSASVLGIQSGQLRFPLAATAFQKDPYVEQDAHGRALTDSGTYATLWRGVLPITTSTVFGVVDVLPDGGVTADVRLGILNLFNPVETLVVAEVTGLTGQDVLASAWSVPDGLRGTPGESSIGGTAEVVIQARVTAGASDVAVAPRLPLTCIVL